MAKPSRNNASKAGRKGPADRRRGSGNPQRGAPRRERVSSTRLENGPILELSLERLAWGGDAVARLDDGRVVFVDGGFPGERVRAQLVEDGKRFARATWLETLETPVAAVAACPSAPACGGCRFQGVPYEQELAWKVEAVAEMLRRLSRETQWPELSVVAAPQTSGYRERVRLRVNDEGVSGYQGRGSNDFVPAPSCAVLHPAMEALRPYAARLAGGLLRVHSFRMEWDDVRNQVVVEIPCDEDSWNDVRQELLRRLAETPVPAMAWGEKPLLFSLTIRYRARWEALVGDGMVHRWYGGARVEQRSGNFSQANTRLNDRLREQVAAWTREGWRAGDGAQRVVDFYAGAGNLSFAIAATQARVVAIDHASEAIDAGEAAFLETSVRRVAAWVAADLSQGPYDALSEHFERADAIVLDPPRGGIAADFSEQIGRSMARKIVYVSCDPAALARDISRLHSFGWRVSRAEAWDMFPRTAHLELLVELHRNW